MHIIEKIESEQIKKIGKTIPDFASGDTIKVGYKITEGERTRIQNYEGVVIARKGGSTLAASFTVRKISFGEGVERVFQLFSPNLDSIEIIRSGKVRKAKLYYLRDRKGKSARINEKIKKKIGVELLDDTSEQKKDTSIDSPIEEEVSSKQKDPKKLEEKK